MSDSNISIASGLDAIFNVTMNSQKSCSTENHDALIKNIAVSDIKPSPYQPRTHFDPISLQELAQSIAKNGIIQPIVVRELGDHYEIIAGERRWRAAQQINFVEVPVIVKNVSNEAAQAFALIENIQRKDLNIIEEARAYKRLLNDLKLSHDEIASRVGKSRSHITNILRLLNLSDSIHQYLEKELIAMGHARALLSLNENDRETVAQTIIAKHLSVRETELLVQKITSPLKPSKNKKESYFENETIQTWVKSLEHITKAKVSINMDDQGRSKLIFNVKTSKELAVLVEKIINEFDKE